MGGTNSMNRILNLLLVEDDEELCNNIRQYVDELSDVSLGGITNSSEKALEYVINYLSDAVVLDLELHRGSGNGLLFLQELNKTELPFHPYILVSTNNSSYVTYEYARKLGVDFIISKHQSDFSPQNVIELLRMMKDVIHSKAEQRNQDARTTEAPKQKEKRIIRMISVELDRIGISPKLVGRSYLTDAIYMTIQKPESNICVIIGRKYGKTDASVERAMQNAINKAWRTSDIDDLSRYYTAKISSDKGVPTLTEFIYYYVNKLKNEL
jgi:Response regulator containing CheY-like receiver, AAA-type ATPase, and DNA-binding domains